MPYNRNLALRILENFEIFFSKDQILAKKYSKTINRYITKGYATKVKSTEGITINITNYINQHKPDKLRVIFDASAKKYKGRSLNDYILVGLDLLNNLVSTILWFRFGKYAVPGDIEQIFHQIRVSPKVSEKKFLNTKRGLLSLLCSVFDLLGVVSSWLIEPKLIIKEL